MDPAQLVLTTVVTAAVTTLVTQGILGVIRASGRRVALSKEPALLRRRGTGWVIFNQSSRAMMDINVSVHHRDTLDAAGMPVAEGEYEDERPASILPRSTGYVGLTLRPGDTVYVNWSTFTRFRQKRRVHSAEVLLKPEIDEYLLSPDTWTDPGHH